MLTSALPAVLVRRIKNKRKLEEIEDGLRRARLVRFKREKMIKRRIQVLEDELGHMTLLCQALAEVCLEARLISAEALAGKMLELDLTDGAADGKLAARKGRRVRATRKPS